MNEKGRPDIIVPIGRIEYTRTKDLICPAVGSCIALCILNNVTGMAGMAHIFLPKAKNVMPFTGGKYADTAITEMVATLCPLDHSADKLTAFVSGGARMFSGGTYNHEMDVGQLNSTAVLADLKARNIEVAFLDVGGKLARNVLFDIKTKKMSVYHGSVKPPVSG